MWLEIRPLRLLLNSDTYNLINIDVYILDVDPLSGLCEQQGYCSKHNLYKPVEF